MGFNWYFGASPFLALADLFADAARFLFLGNAPTNAGGWL